MSDPEDDVQADFKDPSDFQALHHSSGFAPYRRAVKRIMGMIFTLMIGQSAYAIALDNRFLLKDALDWGYDGVLWGVALVVFGRGQRYERIAALAIAGVMLIAGLHTGYDLWDKIMTGRRPEMWVAGWSAISAVSVGIIVVGLMWQFRRSDNALIAATWLSSRNALISTFAFAIAGFAARVSPTQWPELVMDLVVIMLSLQASWAITRKAWHAPAERDGQVIIGVASSSQSVP